MSRVRLRRACLQFVRICYPGCFPSPALASPAVRLWRWLPIRGYRGRDCSFNVSTCVNLSISFFRRCLPAHLAQLFRPPNAGAGPAPALGAPPSLPRRRASRSCNRSWLRSGSELTRWADPRRYLPSRPLLPLTPPLPLSLHLFPLPRLLRLRPPLFSHHAKNSWLLVTPIRRRNQVRVLRLGRVGVCAAP